MMRRLVTAVTLTFAACGGDPTVVVPAATAQAAPDPADSEPNDPMAGLVVAPGAELVVANCISCHGPKQFLQQRGDRETWLGLIRWMQREHGLWPLQAEVEDRIVSYLATHYGPEQRGRRLPIPAALMPPNPFAAPAAERAAGGR